MRSCHRPLTVLLVVSFSLLAPSSVIAVLPPDIIFSVGSQLTQLLATLAVFLVGGIMTVVPFLKGFFAGSRRHAFALIVGGVILIAVAGIYFMLHSDRGSRPPASSGAANGTSTLVAPPGHRFFSDRFVIAGEHEDGSPILIDLIINRKENEGGGVAHYTLLNMIDGASSGKFMEQRMATDTATLPDLLLNAFARSAEPDHSSRESFTFSFDRFGKQYVISTGVFLADFITKNEPEYTMYSSVGTSTFTVGQETLLVHVYYERVYSEDYRPTIFFEGEDKLPSRTTQLIFWDDAGNFYLVDRSEVLAYSPSYASHFWALMKDGDGFTKKAYAGTLFTTLPGGLSVAVSVPELNDLSLRVKLKHQFQGDQTKGWVEGIVEDNSGIPRKVRGQGYFELYGGREQ